MQEGRLPFDATLLDVGEVDPKCWEKTCLLRTQRIASRKTAELLELVTKLVNHKEPSSGRQIGAQFEDSIRTTNLLVAFD